MKATGSIVNLFYAFESNVAVIISLASDYQGIEIQLYFFEALNL